MRRDSESDSGCTQSARVARVTSVGKGISALTETDVVVLASFQAWIAVTQALQGKLQ